MEQTQIREALGAGAYELVDNDRTRTRLAQILPFDSAAGAASLRTDGPRVILTPVPFGGPDGNDVVPVVLLRGPRITEGIGIAQAAMPRRGQNWALGTVWVEHEPEGMAIERALADAPMPAADAAAVALALADTLADLHARKQTMWSGFFDPELLYVQRGPAGWRLTGVAPRGARARALASSRLRGNYNPPLPPPVHLISPEDAVGRAAGPPSEVFTLCACLHWWITGDSLYDADLGAVMQQITAIMNGERRATLALPPALDAIVRAGTALDPAARPTAAELRDRLATFAMA